ncbi:hypothetical protein F511_25103 [Dorcoceras hygrometricum]|uniref:Retrotransposon gag domain-containing protein n=1 Tax=Dorcoceras hygrometricum TaxID=472368 RepID=A0A2Z7ACB4_9LAMI|nr:hypothetical protein F511_25103 [Dorcoceras hygrometricum]
MVEEEDADMWATLDATVLSWIYATISNDLLHTIIEPDATAMEAWNRLRDIFQDNKHSHEVTLEQNFSTTKMENYPNVSAYCQRLKSLADQLKIVGAPVSESRLVLQLVSGLTTPYRGVGTMIRKSDSLPSFYQARSMLTLEESGLAMETTMASDSAMVVAPNEDDGSSFVPSHSGQGRVQQYSGRKQQQNGRKIQAAAPLASRTEAAMVIIPTRLARKDGHSNRVHSRGGVRFLTGGNLSGLLPLPYAYPMMGSPTYCHLWAWGVGLTPPATSISSFHCSCGFFFQWSD